MRLPEWLKQKQSLMPLHDTKQLLRKHRLSTVCEEARCPNKGECFTKPTATFMILGHSCTRHCGFCSVGKDSLMQPEMDEPLRVAQAAKEMGLKYVVVTSPTRDDLPDGGAGQFAGTVKEIKRHLPWSKVEVLTPDFQGSFESLKTVIDSQPDVFNHNVETVPRLYETVRPQADYLRSINFLGQAKRISYTDMKTKSGLMVGLGETTEEVERVMEDLIEAGCDFLTIGQYLMPTRKNLPVMQYIHPDEFEKMKETAYGLGFKFVACSPMARSSMNAEEVYEHVKV